VFITTSRSANDAVVIKLLKSFTNNPLVLEGGAVILDGRKEKRNIKKENTIKVQQLKEIIKKNQRVIADSIDKKLDLLIRFNRSADVEFRIQKKNGGVLDTSESDNYFILERALLKILSKDFIKTFKIEINGSSMSVKLRSINKASTLTHLMNNLNLDRKAKIFAFGDSKSDEPLMKLADIGICVGNEKIKFADIHIPGGDKSTLSVLNSIYEKCSI